MTPGKWFCIEIKGRSLYYRVNCLIGNFDFWFSFRIIHVSSNVESYFWYLMFQRHQFMYMSPNESLVKIFIEDFNHNVFLLTRCTYKTHVPMLWVCVIIVRSMQQQRYHVEIVWVRMKKRCDGKNRLKHHKTMLFISRFTFLPTIHSMRQPFIVVQIYLYIFPPFSVFTFAGKLNVEHLEISGEFKLHRKHIGLRRGLDLVRWTSTNTSIQPSIIQVTCANGQIRRWMIYNLKKCELFEPVPIRTKSV